MAADPATPLSDIRDEPTRAENLVSVLSEKLAITANAASVYGEPIQAHNRTIVPVAQVGYGLGATSGGRDGQNAGGGGGGGGVGARPAGYIEMTDQGTRYVSFSSQKKILAAMAAGAVAGFLIGRLGRQRKFDK